MVQKKIVFTAFTLLCLTGISVFLAACSQTPPLQEKAKDFATKVLTIPSEEFSKIAEINPVLADTAQMETETSLAIKALCDGFVSEQTIADSEGALYQNILLLHSMAAAKTYNYVVDEVSVTASGDRNFRYEAKITSSDSKDPLILIGSIQFDENGLINYFSVEYPV